MHSILCSIFGLVDECHGPPGTPENLYLNFLEVQVFHTVEVHLLAHLEVG